jgi:hypothetical protein
VAGRHSAGRLGKRAYAVVSDGALRSALEADCTAKGLNLYTLKLWEVAGLTRSLLTEPTSQLAQAAGGDGFSRTEHLLFLILDQLRLANWMRSKDGTRNRNRPAPMSPLTQAQAKGRRIGHTDLEPEEAMALLARYGPEGARQDAHGD